MGHILLFEEEKGKMTEVAITINKWLSMRKRKVE